MNSKCGEENNGGERDYIPARARSVKFHNSKKIYKEGVVKVVSQWQKQELLLLRDYKFWSMNVTYHTWIFRKIKIFKVSSQEIDYPKLAENLLPIYFGYFLCNLGCKTETRSSHKCKKLYKVSMAIYFWSNNFYQIQLHVLHQPTY